MGKWRARISSFVLACLFALDAGAGITVLKGFVVERVAGMPLVEHPMMGCFDERGRLFVAESAGANVDFKQLQADPQGKVLVLEDTDGNGSFDNRTVFADKIAFPSGVLWDRGALYVASPPGIWKFEDRDGDGVAETRKQIVGGFGSIGNGADLHGPYLGPEGWLYFCDGRNGHDLLLGDGTRWAGKAACVYRCRVDGTGLEVVFGGGFDNPVEAVFTPEGELLVNVNLFQAQPHRVDAIVFGLDGANYPYAAVSNELKRTGELMPSVGDLGWVATSGFMRYRSAGANDPLKGRYFSTQFNAHRVAAHTVERDGAGFRVTQAEFLSSDDADFHPTDILEDANGSLIVIDTGGWFRIGCPNSQIAKPEAKGAIYRVRREGQKVNDARGEGISWGKLSLVELGVLAQDERPAVRDRAVAALVGRGGDDAAGALERALAGKSQSSQLEALWAMARLDTAASRKIVRERLAHGEIALRVAAAHAIGLSGNREAIGMLIGALSDDSSPALRRSAATALGRLRAREAVGPLLSRSRLVGDRFEEHAVIYALVQIADREGTVAGLRNPNPSVRRAALIALDQMAGGKLTAELVAPELGSENASLREAAIAIVSAHPDWGPGVVVQLRASLMGAALMAPEIGAKEAESLGAAIAAFAGSAEVQSLVGEVLAAEKTDARVRVLLLRAMAECSLAGLAENWVGPVRGCLIDRDERVVRGAIEVVRAKGGEKFDRDLLRLARDGARGMSLRVAALGAVAPRCKSLEAGDFALLMAELAADREALARLAAAQALAGAALDDGQLLELARAVGRAGAVELPALVASFERSSKEQVGLALVGALTESQSVAGIAAADLSRIVAKYPAVVQRAAAPLIAKLEPDRAAQAAHLAELEPLLKGGNASRGQSVFFSKRASCMTCHAAGGMGGHVGPDLSKIGAIRSGRDILESIVFPSASLARGFEPFVVRTKSKETYAGVLAAESAETIVLRTPAEVRIARTSVETIRHDRVSIMPKGLEAQLSREELSDLLAFLQSLK